MKRTTKLTRSTGALLLVGALILPILSACTTSTGAPSCAAPTVTLSSSRVHAGDSVTVTGQNFIQECLDTGQGTSTPAKQIAIVFDEPSASAVTLSTADADSKGRLETTVKIPNAAATGTARIRVGADTTVSIQILDG